TDTGDGGVPNPSDLDPGGRIPVYVQVAALLRQQIMTKRRGDSVLGENALMSLYDISQDTARSALRMLREEGLVETRRGAGTFVASVPPRITVKVGRGDKVTARMPTPAERRKVGVPEGVPVLSVDRPGRGEELFDASRAEVVIEPLPPRPGQPGRLRGRAPGRAWRRPTWRTGAPWPGSTSRTGPWRRLRSRRRRTRRRR